MAAGKRVHTRKMPPRAVSRRIAPKGKRQQSTVKHSPRKLLQLVVSTIILVTVVAVKMTMPDVTQQYGGKLLRLMGEDTDFVAAFSAVGRAVGGDDLAGVITDACTAVFGPQDAAVSHETDRNAVIYGSGVTPQRVDMLQQVLGFAYTVPVSGTITSAFGYRDHPVQGTERFHYGIDIACEKGTVIGAFAAGTVTAVAESSELGKYVELTHPDGLPPCMPIAAVSTPRPGKASGQEIPLPRWGIPEMPPAPTCILNCTMTASILIRSTMCHKKRFCVHIAPSALILLALFLLVSSPLLLLALLGAAVCHELGHCAALYLLHCRITALHITALGAEMQVAGRLSYGGELLAAAAGPAANLLLSLPLAFCGRWWESGYYLPVRS